jgi:hypothetical protein
MAQPFGGHPTFARLKERLQELNCETQKLDGTLVGPDGEKTVWFAVNKGTGAFVVLPDLPDDEHLAPSVIGNIERRLGIETGFASMPH